MARFTLEPDAGLEALGRPCQVYAADWDASGQIPRRRSPAARLDRFGSVDPTEGGRTDRENLMLDWTLHADAAGHLGGPRLRAAATSCASGPNFTFFQDTGLRFVRTRTAPIEDTRRRAGAAERASYIPGDGIEQDDSRWLFGGRARYTRNWFLRRRADADASSAFETRNDDIHVTLQRAGAAQPLLHGERRLRRRSARSAATGRSRSSSPTGCASRAACAATSSPSTSRTACRGSGRDPELRGRAPRTAAPRRAS